MRPKLWCEHCRSFHEFVIIQTEQTHNFKNQLFVLYNDKRAICNSCGHFIKDEDLDEERLIRLANLFQKRTGQEVLI